MLKGRTFKYKQVTPVTIDTITRFNRDTVWLATGVLGSVVFAALVVGVQELHPRKVNPTEPGVQAGSDFFMNGNPAPAEIVNARSSSGNMTPGLESSVDHAVTETSLQETPSAQTEPAAPTSGLAFTPETNRHAHRQDSARFRGTKPRNVGNRSSAASRYVGTKRRLIELWHQSLAKSEKSRSWAAFSNLNRVESKKAAYTVETNH